MTKTQFQHAFAKTLPDLLTNATFVSLLLHMRQNPPAKSPGLREPTTIINEEGELRGYLRAIEDMERIGEIAKPAETKAAPLYSEPAKIQPAK